MMAYAGQTTWLGGSTGSWNLSENWSSGIPQNDDDVAVFFQDVVLNDMTLGDTQNLAVQIQEGKTVTLNSVTAALSGNLTLRGGGTLFLPAGNEFSANATITLAGATIRGFSQVTEVDFKPKLEIADSTQNRFENVTDSYSNEGCNVRLSGAMSGTGELVLYSTGRGITLTGEMAAFAGTLVWNQSGNFFSAYLDSTDLNNATVRLASGEMRYRQLSLNMKSFFVDEGTVLRDTRGFNDSNNITVHGSCVIKGSLQGNTIDFHITDGNSLRVDSAIANAHLGAGTFLSGNGEINSVQYWGNTVFIGNAPKDVLKIQTRTDDSSGTLVLIGEVGKPRTNPVLQVEDPSRFSVDLSEDLKAEHCKLVIENGVYTIYRPDRCVIIIR